MLINLQKLACSAVFFLFSHLVCADPIVITTPVNGVLTTLEVTFAGSEVSCVEVSAFNGCDDNDDFFFSDSSEASVALGLILDHLVDSGGNLFAVATEHFDTSPLSLSALAFIPYAMEDLNNVNIVFISINSDLGFETPTIYTLSVNEAFPSESFVLFSVVNSVPEPGTLVLFSLGVCGLLAFRKRRIH